MGAREGIPSYVAHSAEDGRLEPLEAHLREVSEMAARFAEPLGMAELAADIGFMHDLGKYSDAFQDRVLRDGPKVDHSAASAGTPTPAAGRWHHSRRLTLQKCDAYSPRGCRGPVLCHFRRVLSGREAVPGGSAGPGRRLIRHFAGTVLLPGGRALTSPTQTSQIVTQAGPCGAAGGLVARRAPQASVLCGRGGCWRFAYAQVRSSTKLFSLARRRGPSKERD